MCGIIGYTGNEPAKDILINGLKQLEYRGYDSAGIAVLDPKTGIVLKKKTGKVEELERLQRKRKQMLPAVLDIQDGQLTVELQRQMHTHISRAQLLSVITELLRIIKNLQQSTVLRTYSNQKQIQRL